MVFNIYVHLSNRCLCILLERNNFNEYIRKASSPTSRELHKLHFENVFLCFLSSYYHFYERTRPFILNCVFMRYFICHAFMISYIKTNVYIMNLLIAMLHMHITIMRCCHQIFKIDFHILCKQDKSA